MATIDCDGQRTFPRSPRKFGEPVYPEQILQRGHGMRQCSRTKAGSPTRNSGSKEKYLAAARQKRKSHQRNSTSGKPLSQRAGPPPWLGPNLQRRGSIRQGPFAPSGGPAFDRKPQQGPLAIGYRRALRCFGPIPKSRGSL